MFGRNLAGLGAQPLASKDLNLIINGDFNFIPAQSYVRMTKLAGVAGFIATSDTTPSFTPCHQWAPAPPFRCNNHGMPPEAAGTYDTFIEEDDLNQLNWLTCKTIAGNSDALGGVRIRPFVYFFEAEDTFDLISRVDNTITISFKFKATHAGQYSLALGKRDDKQFTIYSWQYTTPGHPQEISFTITVPRDSLLNNTYGTGLRIYWCYGMNADDPTGGTPCFLSDDSNLNGNWSSVAKPMITRTTDFKWWQTNNASIAISGVQVVVGQYKIPISPRTLDETAFMCRRYGVYFEGNIGICSFDTSATTSSLLIDNYIPSSFPTIVVSRFGDFEIVSEGKSIVVNNMYINQTSKRYSGQTLLDIRSGAGRIGAAGILKTKLSNGWLFLDSRLT